MAELRFNSVDFSQFKKLVNASYDLYEVTDICGRNGSGKTTIGIGLSLPFAGKDLTGKSNPEIHPDSMPESEPHITINAEIDKKPVEIEFIQTDTRTQKQKDQGVPAKIANKYKINYVDKTATLFKKDLLERGIDLDLYESLSNPEAFFSLTEAKKRETVFSMAADISDIDVADALGAEAEDVRKQLDLYTLAEIKAKADAEYKEARERLRKLPEQIIGLEQAIATVDETSLTAQKETLVEDLKNLELQLAELKSVDTENLQTEIRNLQLKQKQIVAQHDAERNAVIRSAKAIYDKAKTECDSLQFSLAGDESRLKLLQNQIDSKTAENKRMLDEYNFEKERTFPETESVCKTCGQTLPMDKIADLKASWIKVHDAKVNRLKEDGNRIFLEIREKRKRLDSESVSVKQKREQLDALMETMAKAEEEYKSAQKLPVFEVTSTAEFDELTAEIAALRDQLSKTNEVEQAMLLKREEIERKKIEIAQIDRELGKTEQNKDIRKKISDLQEEQGQIADNQAQAQAILDQLKAVSKKKNEMLAESVNTRFPSFIRFKLFYVQKDGEEKDCCVPLIKNENGEWKEVGKTANQALEMRAKLAILEGFQNFNDIHVPIILDGASELDAGSKAEIARTMHTQIIFLSVTEDETLTIREV